MVATAAEILRFLIELSEMTVWYKLLLSVWMVAGNWRENNSSNIYLRYFIFPWALVTASASAFKILAVGMLSFVALQLMTFKSFFSP